MAAAEIDAARLIDRDVDAGNAITVIGGADHLAAGLRLELQIATNMIAMMMRVENMAEAPAARCAGREDRRRLGRVGRFTALRVMDQEAVIVRQHGKNDDIQRRGGWFPATWRAQSIWLSHLL